MSPAHCSLFGLIILVIAIVSGEHPQVVIPQGTLKGSVMKTVNGRDFLGFKKIPYAEPPTGELRFKEPEPAGPWDGVLDATNDVPSCPQYDLFIFNKMMGQEDCLYLNVYTPKMPIEEENAKLPVMFFIHGGAFILGSSSTLIYSPSNFLDRDIVLITINYRLGVLGFLSTGDEAAPGNYGLYDQIEALKWAKKNVIYFGGDPDKITIFGESAGSASVSHLVISPKTKGLFHAAILQSGCSVDEWTTTSNPKRWAKIMALKLDCPLHSSQEIVECLKKKTTDEIINAQIRTSFSRFSVVFTPVVENTPDGIFPENPIKLIEENKINHVPIIVGVNRDEGAFATAQYMAVYNIYDPDFLEEDLMDLLPPFTKLENETSRLREIVNFYFKDIDRTNKVEFRSTLIKLFGDSYFFVKSEVFSNLLAKNNIPCYKYKLTYRGKFSFTQLFQVKDDLGVAHADELQYMFSPIFMKALEGDDKKMSELILDMWTNFAKTRHPTSGTKLPFQWVKTDSSAPNYLEINLEPQMVNKPLTDNVNVWTKTISKEEPKHKFEL